MKKNLALEGVMENRMFINYRADPHVVKRILPHPFVPSIIKGYAIIGICLIDLRELGSRWIFPKSLGLASKNTAHRFLVKIQGDDKGCDRFYISRRDCSSFLSTFIGNRMLANIHHQSEITIDESKGRYKIHTKNSKDGDYLNIDCEKNETLPEGSIFSDLQEVSNILEKISIGHSFREDGTLNTLGLEIDNWEIIPLRVHNVQSCYFDDFSIFPKGSIELDHAVLMKNVKHRWRMGDDIPPLKKK